VNAGSGLVTRGTGDYPPTETCVGPTVIIIVVPLVAPEARIYTDGVEVILSSIRRGGQFADIKTGNLIHQVMARQEADSKHAYEAILLTADEKLSDGITSNIYMVLGGEILTPAHDAAIVEGITRGVVLNLARQMGLHVVEGVFDVGGIARADEMFLTSSTREIVPITRANGSTIGSGKPGAVTLMLLKAYREALDQLIMED
jgi:branched-subunit amino acid aminotransferase/4-amino-4-deoxychorismate lyase